MRSKQFRFILALLTAFALFGAACGGDDDGGSAKVSKEAEPYVAALKKSMTSEDEEGDMVLTDKQVDCLAPEFINTIGVDRLKKADVTPEDLETGSEMDFSDTGITEKEANQLYDYFGKCDVNIREQMMQSMADDDDMTPEMKTCMEDIFTEDNLRLLMVSSMVDGEEGMESNPKLAGMMGQLMGCAFMGMGDMMDDFDTGDTGDMDDVDMSEFDDMMEDMVGDLDN